MTPLIAELIKVTPDPEVGHWFDLGEIPSDMEFSLDPELLIHLPYDTVFVVGKTASKKLLIKAQFRNDSVGVAGFIFSGSKTEDIKAFVYAVHDENLAVYPKGAKDRKETMMALAVLDTLLRRLEAPQTAYQASAKESFTNRRKIAQGKKPTYEWRTVLVQPREKTESLGGTHASPRAHDRRGHWRTIKKTGKQHWVKACRVGDPSLGQVFHDYKVAA
jgi:hypothetical protein